MHNKNNSTLIKANFIRTANFLEDLKEVFLLICSRSRIICSYPLFDMKLESISVAGKDANQSGVGKKFLIISISITVLLNLSIAIWFFMNDMGRFLIK